MSICTATSTPALAQAQAAARRRDVDIARALAQFFVVLFHVPQYFMRYHISAPNKDITHLLETLCPYLNIPTFMFVAGFVLAMGSGRVEGAAGYLRYEGKKFCRLMLPFLTVSLLTLGIKLATLKGEDGGGTSLYGVPAVLLNAIITPSDGPAPHLWFLECLMGIFLLWPLLEWMAPSWKTAVLAALVVIDILPIPWHWYTDIPFGLGVVSLFIPYFALGYWFRKRVPSGWHPGLGHVALAGTVLLAMLMLQEYVSWPRGLAGTTAYRATILISNASGAVCLFWLSGVIDTRTRRVGSFLAIVGLYSYDIYLLHVALCGHPMTVAVSKLHPGPGAAYVWFVVTVVVTMFVPMGIGQIIRRFPLLAFVTLGVPLARKPAARRQAGKEG